MHISHGFKLNQEPFNNDCTRELAIKNWGKYNLNKAGRPIIDCVKNLSMEQSKDYTLLKEENC